MAGAKWQVQAQCLQFYQSQRTVICEAKGLSCFTCQILLLFNLITYKRQPLNKLMS